MRINPQIKAVLQEYNIPVADGIAYLLSIFFDCRPSYTPTLLIQRMNVTNILGIDANREVIWHIPLFEGESQTKWDGLRNGMQNLVMSIRKEKLQTRTVSLE